MWLANSFATDRGRVTFLLPALVLGGPGGSRRLPFTSTKPVQLIEGSDLIVEGIVASRWDSQWNAQGSLMYTDYTIMVTKVLKGASVYSVIVRNPGGIDPESGYPIVVGDAASLVEGKEMLLLLTTEDLPFLDMTSGNRYYVTLWSGGAYEISSEGVAINQLHPSHSEPLSHFEDRVAALLEGLPDPHPLPGLPIFRNEGETG